jgi:hypothetical protein
MALVRFDLTSVDSNIFVLTGSWAAAARSQKVSKAVIDSVINEVTSARDYDHALCILIENSIDPNEGDCEEDC